MAEQIPELAVPQTDLIDRMTSQMGALMRDLLLQQASNAVLRREYDAQRVRANALEAQMMEMGGTVEVVVHDEPKPVDVEGAVE